MTYIMKTQCERSCVYVVLLTLLSRQEVTSVYGQEDYLFFASPGSLSPLRKSGFYGGPITYQQYGNGSEIFTKGLVCANLGADEMATNVKVKSIAFDAKTERTLVFVGDASKPNQVTLLRMFACSANHGCPNKQVDVVINTQIVTHKITAFASYSNKVYFLSEKTSPLNANEQQKHVEIRWLYGCKASEAFDVQRCSRKIAEVISEKYTDKPKYELTSGLVVLPRKNSKGEEHLMFYTQLQHTVTDKHISGVENQAFVLFRVTDKGEVSREHEELVHEALNAYTLQGVGQINYRDGFMCWTAMDRVLCGHVDSHGRLSNPRTVVRQPQVKFVCQAPPTQDILSTIATGVAIAKVPKNIDKDELAFYFGCVATSPSMGGAGLVRKVGRGPPSTFPLRHGGSRVLAGSMFMTTPSSSCDSRYIREPESVLSSGSESVSIKGTLCVALVFYVIHTVTLSLKYAQ